MLSKSPVVHFFTLSLHGLKPALYRAFIRSHLDYAIQASFSVLPRYSFALENIKICGDFCTRNSPHPSLFSIVHRRNRGSITWVHTAF